MRSLSLVFALPFALLVACASPPTPLQDTVSVDAIEEAAAPDVASPDVAAPDVATEDAAIVVPPRDPPTAAGFLPRYPLRARFPEGGAYDPTGRSFYVGSLGDGSVSRIDAADGAETVLFTETAAGRWWTLGMDVDVSRRRLWVCAMDDRSPAPRAGFIWVFDLTSGARIANIALSAAATNATCTDVALTADGRGYVGDRETGNAYRVELMRDAELLVTSPALQASLVGQNSMIVLPGDNALLSVLYLPSALARISIADRAARRVSVAGGFSDPSFLSGADGMAYQDGSAYVAFTSKLVRLTPTSADWTRATAQATDWPSGLTDVIATPNGLYLLNGQAVRFAQSTPPEPFALVRFDRAL